MVKREIDRWTFWYFFFQKFWAWTNLLAYYKKIGIYNKKAIPKNAPLIIAPNHQNALMDALVFVTQGTSQRIFLTRADVFNKPLIQRILFSWKMLPIFRIRDGKENLKKNDEIFATAAKVVQNGRCPLFMFPEGNHGGKRRLRPLVKGIFRIAFQAQEKYKDQPGVKIVPAGLDYEHYQKFDKKVMVFYGEPIEVCEYWKLFEENPAAANNALRKRLSEEMKKQMIHIETDEYYDTYMELREIGRISMAEKFKLNPKKQFEKFKSDKQMIAALDKVLEEDEESIKKIDLKTKEYVSKRDNLNLREWVLRKKRYSYLGILLRYILSILLLPVLIFGLITNGANFFIPMKFRSKIKDPQFRSTAVWGMNIVIQFVTYPILIVLAFVFFPYLWLKIAFIILLPVFGKAAWQVYKLIVKTTARLRYNFKRKSNQNFKDVINLREEIVNQLNTIVS
jgi:1-acyl-sn-glycerol-3-phosphate acyltransferase